MAFEWQQRNGAAHARDDRAGQTYIRGDVPTLAHVVYRLNKQYWPGASEKSRVAAFSDAVGKLRQALETGDVLREPIGFGCDRITFICRVDRSSIGDETTPFNGSTDHVEMAYRGDKDIGL